MQRIVVDASWKEVTDAVARARGWPTADRASVLGGKVRALSAMYNDPVRSPFERTPEAWLAARLVFSLPRDLPKSAAAVRELVRTGVLAIPESGRLRVLDLGAGLGATTLGVGMQLQAAGQRGVIEAVWVDSDARALDVGREVARRRKARDAVAVETELVTEQAVEFRPRGRFDLVLVGQTLSELDRELDEASRADRHAAWLLQLLERSVDEAGSLVVVEPALRDRTRHLHAVRERLRGRATVFAPCLHDAACPMLVRDRDWCHEDLPIDLPNWLVAIARQAGLRWQGLTLSYLVLRRDDQTLASALGYQPARASDQLVRLVSGIKRTKGRREVDLCGYAPESSEGSGAVMPTEALLRVDRLDRARSEPNAAFDDACRGDVWRVRPPLGGERRRIDPETTIAVETCASDTLAPKRVAR